MSTLVSPQLTPSMTRGKGVWAAAAAAAAADVAAPTLAAALEAAELDARLAGERVDLSLPPAPQQQPHWHPPQVKLLPQGIHQVALVALWEARSLHIDEGSKGGGPGIDLGHVLDAQGHAGCDKGHANG